MVIHIALLRGINVAGHAVVAMSDLRDLVASLGFTRIQLLLQSGNLIFDGGRKSPATLERLLEAETSKRLNKSIDCFVRSADDWPTIIDRNPFPSEAKRDPGHLVITFLKQAPPAKALKMLQAAIRGPEIVRLAGKELYVVYPAGIGRSKLTNALIEKTLGTRATARNWNTILKIASAISDS